MVVHVAGLFDVVGGSPTAGQYSGGRMNSWLDGGQSGCCCCSGRGGEEKKSRSEGMYGEYEARRIRSTTLLMPLLQ